MSANRAVDAPSPPYRQTELPPSRVGSDGDWYWYREPLFLDWMPVKVVRASAGLVVDIPGRGLVMLNRVDGIWSREKIERPED